MKYDSENAFYDYVVGRGDSAAQERVFERQARERNEARRVSNANRTASFECTGNALRPAHIAPLNHANSAVPGKCRLCSYGNDSLAQFVNDAADMNERMRLVRKAPKHYVKGEGHD